MTACHKKLHFTKQTGQPAWYTKQLLNRFRSCPLRPLCPVPETSSTIIITIKRLRTGVLHHGRTRKNPMRKSHPQFTRAVQKHRQVLDLSWRRQPNCVPDTPCPGDGRVHPTGSYVVSGIQSDRHVGSDRPSLERHVLVPANFFHVKG